MKCYHFDVYGRVQKVMFRQTLMRAALKRGLKAAGSNDSEDGNHVECYLAGDETECLEVIERLSSGMKLNSWGASVERLELRQTPDAPLVLTHFQVSTNNVDDFNWSEGVEFYL